MSNLHHRLADWAIDSPLFPNHMSFIVGPRQSGKTTLALQALRAEKLPQEKYYLNWDRPEIRRRFREGTDWLSTLRIENRRPFLIFDEIHKTRQWKRLLKGIYDQFKGDFRFIVTGSGRLDHYQRGGDSLAGRYDPYLLFPFTPGEIENVTPAKELKLDSLLASNPLSEDLISTWEKTGGFPEPFLSGSETKARAWWKQYQLRVTEEDLRDLTRLESVDLMRQIVSLLPIRVGSPLSMQAIREDVETSFATVKRYLSTLNQLFLTFEISPYSKKIHRAVKKEKKTYFFHHPAVSDEGARFENMVAVCLKRWISEKNERAQGEYELHYLRDQDRREVDFLVTLEGRPHFLFEAKRSDTEPTTALRYYANRLAVPGIQIVRTPGIKLKKSPGLATLSFHFLARALG